MIKPMTDFFTEDDCDLPEWQRRMSPEVLKKLSEKLEASLVKNGDCLETKYAGPRKYGKIAIWFKGKSIQVIAHRFAYFVQHGSVQPGMHICHSCDNPRCCNPDHLFQGTAKENQQDCIKKGRKPVGERHPMAKLRPVQIDAIFSLNECGFTTARIGEIFGVSQSHISEIINGKYWSSFRAKALLRKGSGEK